MRTAAPIEQFDRSRIVGWDGHEVDLAVVIDMFDPHDHQNRWLPATTTRHHAVPSVPTTAVKSSDWERWSWWASPTWSLMAEAIPASSSSLSIRRR